MQCKDWNSWQLTRAVMPALMVALAAGACDNSTTGPGGGNGGPGPVPVARVEIKPGSVQLQPGEEITLTAVARAADNKALLGRQVTWHSYNTAVATVSSTGKVSAVGEGSAVIRATIDMAFGELTVGVKAHNTVPTLSSVTPDVVETTARVAVVTLRGAGFAADAMVVWNGLQRPATYVDASELRLVLGPNDLGTAGPQTIAVFNPAPGGGTSDALPLTIVVGASSIVVTPSQVTLSVGQSVALEPRAFDANGGELIGRTFTFASSNQGAISVSTAGVVTAHGVGPALITVSTGGISVQVPVTAQPAVQSVWVSPIPAAVLVGSTTDLTARALGAGSVELTGRTFAWSSANPSIATVDSSGRVTGVTKGTVRVFATSEGVVGWTDVEVRQWGPGPVSSLTLRGFTETIVWLDVGTTTYVDGQGVSHQATMTLWGGTLTMRFDSGRWTRTYDIRIHVDGMHVSNETWTEQGNFGYLWTGDGFWFTADGSGQTAEGRGQSKGELKIRQAVGTGPVLTQHWVLQ